MTSFPVIERELRVKARQRDTYSTRLVTPLIATIGLTMLYWDNPRIIRSGAPLFAMIHGCMAGALLLLAPLWVADSISRERREGTLGLLFLTPLTARSIILGKFGAHLCRLFYLWLMMIPFLLLPILIGGVSLERFFVSAAILLSILMVGASAGMIASSTSIGFGSAVARALLFGLLANHLIATIVTNVPFQMLRSVGNLSDLTLTVRLMIVGPVFVFLPEPALEAFNRIFAIRNLGWSMAAGWVGASFLVFLAAIAFCARKIARHAESGIETVRQAAIRRRFFKPVLWKGRFRRSMSRRLDTNPLNWLEYRSPFARAGRWAAVLAVILLQNFAANQMWGRYAFFKLQLQILSGLLLVIALKSASSFHQEKEIGAFELILTTAISEKSLVVHRLRAVWRYFAPISLTVTFFLLFALQRDAHGKLVDSVSEAVLSFSLWLSILSIPAVGLYFSLRFNSFFKALFLTAATTICAPSVVWLLLIWTSRYLADELAVSFFQILNFGIDNFWLPQLAAIALGHCLIILISQRKALEILVNRSFTSHPEPSQIALKAN